MYDVYEPASAERIIKYTSFWFIQLRPELGVNLDGGFACVYAPPTGVNSNLAVHLNGNNLEVACMRVGEHPF